MKRGIAGFSIVGAVIAAASCSWACERPERPLQAPGGAAQRRSNPSAPSSASAGPSASPNASANPTEASAGNIAIQLVTEPGAGPENWYVVAKSPELALNVRLAEFNLPFLCGVAPLQTTPKRTGALLVCPPGVEVELSVEGDRLSIDRNEQQLPPGIRVELPTSIEQPNATACDTAQDLPPFVVQMKRRLVRRVEEGERFEYALELTLGDRVSELFRVPQAPLACGTTRVFRKSDWMSVACSGPRIDTRVIDIQEKERTLFVDWHKQGVFADATRHRIGFRLPCGAPLRLRPTEFKDAGVGEPYGEPCDNRCDERAYGCEDPCYARWADDYGVLSPEGEACIARCAERKDKCLSDCSAALVRRLTPKSLAP